MPKRSRFLPPSYIFVFLYQSDKSFFIWRCAKESLYETYRHHIKGRRTISQEFIEHIPNCRPCVFIVEEVHRITYRKAYRRMIAWAKVLIDKGYRCYNPGGFLDATDDLYIDTEIIYDEIKNIAIEDALTCEKCLFPTYSNIPCKQNKTYGKRKQDDADKENEGSEKRKS